MFRGQDTWHSLQSCNQVYFQFKFCAMWLTLTLLSNYLIQSAISSPVDKNGSLLEEICWLTATQRAEAGFSFYLIFIKIFWVSHLLLVWLPPSSQQGGQGQAGCYRERARVGSALRLGEGSSAWLQSSLIVRVLDGEVCPSPLPKSRHDITQGRHDSHSRTHCSPVRQALRNNHTYFMALSENRRAQLHPGDSKNCPQFGMNCVPPSKIFLCWSPNPQYLIWK